MKDRRDDMGIRRCCGFHVHGIAVCITLGLFLFSLSSGLSAAENIRFNDGFIWDQTEKNQWMPVSGAWEIISPSLRFCPDRGTLFARLSSGDPVEEKVFDPFDRKWFYHPQLLGIGLQCGTPEGFGTRIEDLQEKPILDKYIVRHVFADSPAAKADIRKGDMILAINGERVAEDEDMHLRYLINPWPFSWLSDGVMPDISPWNIPERVRFPNVGEEIRIKYSRKRVMKTVELAVARLSTPHRNIVIEPYKGSSQALLVTGHPEWRDYLVAVSVKPEKKESFGIIISFKGSGDYYLLRAGGEKGEAQIIKVAKNEEVLASVPLGLKSKQWYRLGVMVSKSEFEVYVDGRMVLSAPAPKGTDLSGKVGLYATGENCKGVYFDDFSVLSVNIADAQLQLTDPFFSGGILRVGDIEESLAQDSYYGPEWRKDDSNVQWCVYSYPSDSRIYVTYRNRKKEKPTKVYLRSEAGGQLTELMMNWDMRTINTLDGRTIEFQPVQRSAMIHVMDGAIETIGADGESVRISHNPDLNGTFRIGMTKETRDIYAPIRVVSNEHLFESDFWEVSPVSWEMKGGQWGVSRFSCFDDSKMNFLGGGGREEFGIWHKGIFDGDVSFEFFGASLPLVRDPDPISLEKPSDQPFICVTICGDGKDFRSGYAVASERLDSKEDEFTLLRNGKAVATFKGKKIFPAYGDWKWHHLKLRMNMDTITFFLNGKALITYKDPKPLLNGRVGLWSEDTAFRIGRARILFEKRRGIATVSIDGADRD